MAARHIKYRPGAYDVMGYTELVVNPPGHATFRVLPKADATNALPIKSIRLGPLLHEEHLDSVVSIVRNHGLDDVKVERSRVPLR